MIIGKWYHSSLERLTSVTDVQSHDIIIVRALCKDVAANQQKAVVISEIWVKLGGPPRVRVPRGIEVERSVNVGVSDPLVCCGEVDTSVIVIPVCIGPGVM